MEPPAAFRTYLLNPLLVQVTIMVASLQLDSSASAVPAGSTDPHAIAADVAYSRVVMVNVVFIGEPTAGDRGWVLVDAGLPGTEGMIRAAAEKRFGEEARPSAIVLTHGHFDHVGALASLAQRWEVPIYAHRLEHPYLNGEASYPPADPSVGGGLMALVSPLYPRGPIDVSARLRPLPEDGTLPGLPGWEWLHTPGHSVGHVSLWREKDRTLVAGDAVITTKQESALAVLSQRREMHGPPQYYTVEWDKAGQSVNRLARLQPECVVTGHGEAVRGAPMRHALARLAREFDHLAVPSRGRFLRRPARAEDRSAYC
jgi:glyoxylase-like metal-dependent hydrolase (beta-lactamase superfamily II)